MSDLEFEEEKSFSPNTYFEEKKPKFVQKVIDWGLAKDAKSANFLLLIVALVFFSVSIFIFLKYTNLSNNTDVPKTEDIENFDEFLIP